MFESTYDIIEWKSCASSTSTSLTNQIDSNRQHSNSRVYPFSREDGGSSADIVFPALFHERGTETSIVSLPELDDLECDPLLQDTVYQKVANWVMMQKKYFRNVEVPIEDDEMEVIDPVDLFHESVLDDYQLITENESERRILLRDFGSHEHHITSIEQAMLIQDYKFLRQPSPGVEMELNRIVDFHRFNKNKFKNKNRKRRNSGSIVSSFNNDVEDDVIDFLGVPRLLENYVILNREGYAVKLNPETDLWLSPLEEELLLDEQNQNDNFDLDFYSSWFSDVYQTDINTDEIRTLITMNTDLLEKATIISVDSEDEVWVDAPDIPHWLDESYEELELFNQPSRPLYYYRDRIKGCYRIIGVEDETVVLFSGNDDDTIFYPGDSDDTDLFTTPNVKPRKLTKYQRISNIEINQLFGEGRPRISSSYDRKNDSGIEDVDDMISEDVAIVSTALSSHQAKVLGYNTQQIVSKTVKFLNKRRRDLFVERLLLITAGVIVLLAFFFNRTNNSQTFQINVSR